MVETVLLASRSWKSGVFWSYKGSLALYKSLKVNSKFLEVVYKEQGGAQFSAEDI